MNDNNIRGEQWEPLVADYFVKHFGGDHIKWMEANHLSVNIVSEKLISWTKDQTSLTHKEFKDYENKLMIESMFSYVGLEKPPKDQYDKIWLTLEQSIPSQTNSAYPGIISIIKSLYNDGHSLYTSSGESSLLLEGYTEAMGIKSLFKTLYGPDLISVMKTGRPFFEAILNDSGVDPKNTIVIDDKPYLLKQIQGLGVHTIQSCIDGEYKPEIELHYTNPSELYELITKLKFY